MASFTQLITGNACNVNIQLKEKQSLVFLLFILKMIVSAVLPLLQEKLLTEKIDDQSDRKQGLVLS